MSEHPNDTAGDIAAWGLTHSQAAHYLGVIAVYHAQRSRFHAARARFYAGRAATANRAVMILTLLTLVLLAINEWGRVR